MSIFYWRYQLLPKRPLSAIAGKTPRQGALILVDGGVADVHPWPELGDANIDSQLDRLRRGETTPLTRRSLAMAHLDRDARTAAKSLFEGQTIPPSHWAAAAGDVPEAFATVKVKMGPGLSIDPALGRYRLRLDFNGTLTAGEFESFVRSLPTAMKSAIDFVEDPCEYDGSAWQALREATGVRLALDHGEAEEGVDVLVVKPAVQEMPVTKKEVVITSYMDHPVGQLFAAYTAAKERIGSTCGLATHLLFESDPFIERMQLDGARLQPVGGTGIGFDDLLEKLEWKRLA